MSLSSQHHSFDIYLAHKYGVDEAILIHHFQHWIRVNRSSGKNLKEGRCWTYQTKKEIQAIYPYWTLEQIKYTCEKLVEKGVLLKGNFNKIAIDKTTWYAFVDEEAFGVGENEVKSLNTKEELKKCLRKGKFPIDGENSLSTGKIPSPIPDTKTKILEEDKEREKEKPTQPLLVSFGNCVKLKQEDYDKFCQEHGKEFIDDIIDTLNNKIEAGDTKAPKSYPAKLREWIKNKKKWDAEDKKTAIIKPTSNIEFAKKVKEKFKNNREIEIGDQAIVFIGGQCPLVIKYTDYGFKEQVLNRLRKMNLSTEGLS